mgnify:CR=1 FL=1
MKYSLINVEVDHGETVDGNWIQDVTGTFEDALRIAQETEKANSGRIQVAIVEQIDSSVVILGYWKNLKKIHG